MMNDTIPLDQIATRDPETGLLFLRVRPQNQIPVGAQVRDPDSGFRGVVIPTRVDEEFERSRDEMVSVQWLDDNGKRLGVITLSRVGFPYELIDQGELGSR